MRYTIIIKKVIKEVIGLITIVLFIYTCTKVRASAGFKGAAVRDTIKAGNAIEFGWPVQSRGYYPLLPRHCLPEAAGGKKASGEAGNNVTSKPTVISTSTANMGARYQVARIAVK